MPNGYKKNLCPRTLARKARTGSSSWDFCRCASCSRDLARIRHGTKKPELARGGRRASLLYFTGYIQRQYTDQGLGPRRPTPRKQKYGTAGLVREARV